MTPRLTLHRSQPPMRIGRNGTHEMDQSNAGADPTPEQLADKCGRDDGIPCLTADEFARRQAMQLRGIIAEVARLSNGEAHPHGGNRVMRIRNAVTGDVYNDVLECGEVFGISACTVYKILNGQRCKRLPALKLERMG